MLIVGICKPKQGPCEGAVNLEICVQFFSKDAERFIPISAELSKERGLKWSSTFEELQAFLWTNFCEHKGTTLDFQKQLFFVKSKATKQTKCIDNHTISLHDAGVQSGDKLYLILNKKFGLDGSEIERQLKRDALGEVARLLQKPSILQRHIEDRAGSLRTGPIDADFFAYCASHLNAPAPFNPENIEGGIHIPTKEEFTVIAERGRLFLDNLSSIKVPGFSEEGSQLFRAIWSRLSSHQKESLNQDEKSAIRSGVIEPDHPFHIFTQEFVKKERNIHLLTRVFGRFIDDGGYKSAWATFQNLLTGNAQTLICPAPRWYLPVSRTNGGRDTYAEISPGPHGIKIFQLKDNLNLDQCQRQDCPFFPSGSTEQQQRCIHEWNRNCERNSDSRNMVQEKMGAHAVCLSRSILYHYSGVSTVVSLQKDLETVSFVTAGRHCKLSFRDWKQEKP